MQNETIIQGRVITAFEYSHSVMGEPFYKSSVSVIRESHTEDKIPVVVPGSKIQKEIIKTGNRVYIKGQFRSYDCKQKESYNLRLFVFVNAIEEARSNKDENNALLDGYICKKPTFRKTPLGREISDVILAVPRQYGKTDYIPCVLWGKNALFASVLPVGEQLSVSGRIQSREYSKPGETQQRTAYEVSIARLI